MATVRIPLGSRKYPGLVVLIDEEDDALVGAHHWWLAVRGEKRYAVTEINGRDVYMHRLILGFPKGKQVDHANHDGLDNRRANLREATKAQNMQNVAKSVGSSRYRGVHKHYKLKGRWVAQVTVDGRTRHVGIFHSEIDAARARDAAARKYHGEFAYLNFPDEEAA